MFVCTADCFLQAFLPCLCRCLNTLGIWHGVSKLNSGPQISRTSEWVLLRIRIFEEVVKEISKWDHPGSGWVLNFIVSVLIRDKRRLQKHWGEGDVKTEAGTGVINPQAKELQGSPQKLEEAKKDSPLECSEMSVSLPTLWFWNLGLQKQSQLLLFEATHSVVLC